MVYDEESLISGLMKPESRRKSFEMMVKQYGEQLYWCVRRMVLVHEDADDVLQNVFIKAWNSVEQFRNESKLYTWLYRIAVNECLDFLRKNKKMTEGQANIAEESVCNMLMADEYFDGNEAEAKLYEAIAKLPEVQKMVFTLKYFDNMKYKDMSIVMGTTEGALKASYHIAVKKISEYLLNRD